MKKILWVSRHEPLPSQIKALRRLFGEVELVQDSRPFDSAEEILARYREGDFDDLLVVAPLSVIGRLVDLGLRPLWSEMELVEDSSASAEVEMTRRNGRVDRYRFVRFRRVVALRLEFEDFE